MASAHRWVQGTLDPQHLQHAVELLHQRLPLRHIASLLQAPCSTVARTLSRLGLERLRNLEPQAPVQRYELLRPGDLICIDVKSLARFRKVGHRITGERQQGRSYRVGEDKVHVAIDTLGLRHIRTRPYTPRTNSKAERLIQTLDREWAYAMALQKSAARNRWLSRYQGPYNGHRCHMALGGLSPEPCLQRLLVAE